MAEKNYVVNVKTKLGTIITVRGDSAEELNKNISDYIDNGLSHLINTLEDDILSGGNTAIDIVRQTLGMEQVETPSTGFSPVPPPATVPQPTASGTSVKECMHGVMTKREGSGQWGPYKAYYCPTEKGTVGQCKPIYIKPNNPEWNTF